MQPAVRRRWSFGKLFFFWASFCACPLWFSMSSKICALLPSQVARSRSFAFKVCDHLGKAIPPKSKHAAPILNLFFLYRCPTADCGGSGIPSGFCQVSCVSPDFFLARCRRRGFPQRIPRERADLGVGPRCFWCDSEKARIQGFQTLVLFLCDKRVVAAMLVASSFELWSLVPVWRSGPQTLKP